MWSPFIMQLKFYLYYAPHRCSLCCTVHRHSIVFRLTPQCCLVYIIRLFSLDDTEVQEPTWVLVVLVTDHMVI